MERHWNPGAAYCRLHHHRSLLHFFRTPDPRLQNSTARKYVARGECSNTAFVLAQIPEDVVSDHCRLIDSFDSSNSLEPLKIPNTGYHKGNSICGTFDENHRLLAEMRVRSMETLTGLHVKISCCPIDNLVHVSSARSRPDSHSHSPGCQMGEAILLRRLVHRWQRFATIHARPVQANPSPQSYLCLANLRVGPSRASHNWISYSIGPSAVSADNTAGSRA